MNRTKVFIQILGRGAVKAVVEFSGGNDEGGVDSIKLYDAEGKEVADLDEYSGRSATYDEETRSWKGPEDSEDNLLAQALAEPVYDKYSSFAGDFRVSGTVVWDALNNKVTMSGDEAVDSYQFFEDEV